MKKLLAVNKQNPADTNYRDNKKFGSWLYGLMSVNDLIEKISMLELEIKFRDDVILTAGKLSETGRSFRDCLYDAKCYIGLRAEYNALDTERIYKTMVNKN